ncbi:MAG: hypothetical protein JWP87_1670 [Labilithrix sp.]|nr:hypothetical protein [Labilithrix sp.]
MTTAENGLHSAGCRLYSHLKVPTMPSLRPLFVLSLVTLGAVGCAAPSDDPATEAESVDQNEEALTACGATKYNEALAHYKNAVAWSKDRNANGVCNSDNGFLWSIADEASRAVMTCGEFRSVIRTSPWAAPLRTALAPSLTLRSLTGELLVIKNSSYANWTGAEKLFQSGISFWARAEGAYGSKVRIDFAANGKATWGELVMNDVTGDITWSSTSATYSITKANARESGVRTVTVVHAGKTQKFTLGVENPVEYGAAPLFTLQPTTTTSTTPKLYSLVSECDA